MPATLTFADEFNSLSLWNGTSGTWSTTYWYHDALTVNGGSLPSNGEQEWYINANYAPTAGVKPWTVDNGILTITAAPAAAEIQPLINGYKYTSGEINSYHSFSQTYGYFEMRAELPHGQGLWPAFWLLPENGNWPPELDIMEVLGNDTGTLYTTVHSAASGSHTSSGIGSVVTDTSVGYHTYGVDWESDKITWYFDGKAIYSVATPADMHSPMYIIANLAVGGYWPGNADGSTPFPAKMNVDYIHVYSAKPDDITPPPSTPPSDAGVIRNGVDAHVSTLTGGAGADTLITQHQADTLTGGAGADIFVFKQLPWTAGHVTDFQVGVDKLDFSALYAASHYTGSDPIADGYVSLASDGAGGIKVLYDPDGRGTAQAWPYLITTLDHVATGGLTATQLFGGAAAPPPAPTPPAPPAPPTSPPPGVALSGSDTARVTLTGGAGADTLTTYHMGDTLTGGAGADAFVFKVVPWNAGHVTDFQVGVDKLDLSAVFSAAHYSGADPMADGHIILAADGLGGTRVYFDPDGPLTGSPWPFLITTLDKVLPGGLSSAQLFGGAATSPPPAPTPAPTTPPAGLTLSGNDTAASNLTGGAGADTLTAAHLADTLTGGAGHDLFRFDVLPWNAGHVTDFKPGEDTLDLRGIFRATSYHGSDPVADGYLILRDDGHGGTQVLVDIDGRGTANPWPVTITTLDHVSPSNLHASDWLIG